jgi:uncharacterized protein YjeT (DUF2065 family)
MAASLGMTNLLALFIGLYLVAGGIALIREPDFYRQALVGLRDDAVAGFVTGLVAFVIGAVIVSLHNTWDTVLAAFVSLIGWVALVEGLALIAVRRDFLDLAARLVMTGTVLRAVSIGSVVIGVLPVIVSLS